MMRSLVLAAPAPGIAATVAAAILAFGPGGAWAQAGAQTGRSGGSDFVCTSQQAVEQVVQSRGEIWPDGCRRVRVTRLATNAGEVCRVELGPEEGVAGALRDVVSTNEWWTPCANLRLDGAAP